MKEQENDLGKLITNEQIKNLRAFLTQTLDSTKPNGEPDMEKILYNATYNMGEGAVEIAGLLFQEKVKLENLEDAYRKAKKAKYEETMNTRMGWSPTNEGVRIMVEGDETISDLKKKLEKQRLYVEMLANAQEIVRYYPRNAQSLVNVATYGKEIGKIIG